MRLISSIRGQGGGETVIKLLVVAIIAVIAIALAKSYFQESSKKVEETVQEVYDEGGFGSIAAAVLLLSLLTQRKNAS